MSLITIVWSMGISACLTMALLHLVVWARDRTARAHLAYAVMALGAAGIAACELGVMWAETVSRIGAAIRWMHVPGFVLVAAIVVFVRVHLGTARMWLGVTALLLRLLSLILNFLLTPNLNYRAITGVTHVPLFGEMVAVPVGVLSPWLLVGQVSGWLLFVFTVDASVRLWRQGNHDQRRRAVYVGGALSLCLLLGFGRSALVLAGVGLAPIVVFPFLAVIVVMGYELTLDVLRTAQLTRQLQMSEAALRTSEERMTIAAEAARLGMWIGDLPANRIWVTDKCRELFGFDPEVDVTYEDFVRRLHPDDSEKRARAIERAVQTRGAYATEYRVVLPDGTLRWIASHGSVECDASGIPVRMLGACIDVTEQREAERAARELSGRLITAQEDERRRIARDLHDDLSQRLALLSVQTQLLGRGESGADAAARAERMAAQIRELSTEVHKISYQLHPAKLDQLGLVTAVQSWCREQSEQTGLHIDLAARDVPADLAPEISLCLYRIIQESLRNVARHSQASAARVELTAEAGNLKLSIVDEGQGFDMNQAKHSGGLGLVSMQERMRLLNGSIAVHSSPGRGTRVEATLPLLPEHLPAP